MDAAERVNSLVDCAQLKSVRIRGFASIRDWVELELEPASRLSVLVGPNNSGKSNVLDALLFSVFSRGQMPPAEELELVFDVYESVQLVLTLQFDPSPTKGYLLHKYCWPTDESGQQAEASVANNTSKENPNGQYQDLANSHLNKFAEIGAHKIPAFRRCLASEKSYPLLPDGSNLVLHLAGLQSPPAHLLARNRDGLFLPIQESVRYVFQDSSLELIVAQSPDQIAIRSSQEGDYDLSQVGSGFEDVLHILSMVHLHKEKYLLIEEPELHLHPALLVRLVRHIMEIARRPVFVATHAHILANEPGANVCFVRKFDGGTQVQPVLTKANHKEALDCLGVLPSQLLQTNALIWVEGPSDQIYIDYWLKCIDEELQDGVHYSFCYTNGKIAAHYSAADDDSVDALVRVLAINRRNIAVFDRDTSTEAEEPAESYKRRLKTELPDDCFHYTDGRTIENMISWPCLERFGVTTGGKEQDKYAKLNLRRKTETARQIVQHMSKHDVQMTPGARELATCISTKIREFNLMPSLPG